jgi:hypothetical protein
MKIDAKTTIRRYLVGWYNQSANGVLSRSFISRVVDIYQDKDDDDDVCCMQTVLMEEGCYGLVTVCVELN